MVIASGDDLEEAIYEATNEAVEHIKNCLNIKWEEAYIQQVYLQI